MVEDLEIGDAQITACVYGSSAYEVCLTFGGDGLGGACTCPYGRDGFFCKHCVAVGLSVPASVACAARGRTGGGRIAEAAGTWSMRWEAAQAYLELLDAAGLPQSTPPRWDKLDLPPP